MKKIGKSKVTKLSKVKIGKASKAGPIKLKSYKFK
jgi:hypothetical protein